MNHDRSPLFDARQVRRAFSRASAGYASAAALQREVEARLLGLTRLIEEGYFSGRVQDERLWEAVLAVTQRLEATLPGAGGGVGE